MTPRLPLAVSQRQAARLLGIGRDRVRELVRDSRLREVPWGAGRRRIPLVEIERLAAEGFSSNLPAARPKRSARFRATRCDPEALRKLDVNSL